MLETLEAQIQLLMEELELFLREFIEQYGAKPLGQAYRGGAFSRPPLRNPPLVLGQLHQSYSPP